MTVVTATLFSILLSSVAFALPVTNTGNTTIVAQLPSPTKTCVTAGSHEQYCIDKEELHDFISIPVFQPYFDCFKQFSTCEVQEDGECGWRHSAELDDCFTERAAEFYNNEDDEIPAGNPFQDLFDEMNGHDSDDNSDGASEYEDYPSSCVTAGSQSQFCIDEKDLSGFISTPVYHPKFDCFAKTSTCTIQSNKRCGWSETSALNDCLSNFEESEDQDEDPASAENDQSSCVIVGTQGEICMSKSEAEGKVFITQWLPENDCYKKSKAVCAAASASSSCTWQPSALLDSCLETFKDNSN